MAQLAQAFTLAIQAGPRRIGVHEDTQFLPMRVETYPGLGGASALVDAPQHLFACGGQGERGLNPTDVGRRLTAKRSRSEPR